MPGLTGRIAVVASATLTTPLFAAADQIVARAPTGVTPEAETELAQLAEPRRIVLAPHEDALTVARRLCGRLTDTYVEILQQANAAEPDAGNRAIVPACFVTRLDETVSVIPGESLSSVVSRNVGLAGPKSIAKVLTTNFGFEPFSLGAGVIQTLASAPVPEGRSELVLPVTTEPIIYTLKPGTTAKDAAKRLLDALGAPPNVPNLPQPVDEMRLESDVDPALVGKGQCGGAAPPDAAEWPFAVAGVLAALERDTAFQKDNGQSVVPTSVAAVVDNGVDGIFTPALPRAEFNVIALEAANPSDGIDQDGNGTPDDVVGINVMTLGAPSAFPEIKDPGHGSMMASLVLGGGAFRAARDAAKVAPRVLIRPVSIVQRTVTSVGGINQVKFNLPPAAVERAVDYAVKNQAWVVNLSVSSENRLDKLETAVINHPGLMLVVASGNRATPLDKSYRYPAGMSGKDLGYRGRVVTVAAHDRKGCLSAFSGHGSGTVDLAAPGEKIEATGLNGQLVTSEGTSQATAITSFFAALLRSEGLITAAAIKDRLLATVDPKSYLIGSVRSEGLLNGIKALRIHDDVVETGNQQLHFGRLAAPVTLGSLCPSFDPGVPTRVVKISKRIDGGDPSEVRVLVSYPMAEDRRELIHCKPNDGQQSLTRPDGSSLQFKWSDIVDVVPRL